MILAIETSCDDSAVAVIDLNGKLMANEISSQIKEHAKYGGIVPEIASRSHLKSLPLLLEYTLEKYQIDFSQLTAIAVTYAPGLIGSLLVGVSYAKTLAWIQDIPLIPVDHLEGHLLAPFLEHDDLEFPFVGLIVSGGHTHLLLAESLGKYQLLGKTLDDAAGEAFDKVGKMLGFKYPGGPLIDKIATSFVNPNISLPIPLKNKKTMNFSYSGLKTAVKNIALEKGIYKNDQPLINYEEFMLQPDDEAKKNVCNLIASFQKTMAETIAIRCKNVLQKTKLKRFVLSGGVAANQEIRNQLEKVTTENKAKLFTPSLRYCTDNAAMIAYTAWRYLQNGGEYKTLLTLNPSSMSPISQL